MKMKKILYAFLTLSIAVIAGSCQHDVTDTVITEEVELSILPSIDKMNQVELTTRASSASFFEDEDEITVTVTTSRSGNPSTEHTYTFESGTFSGDFFFRPDNTYITGLDAIWPSEGSPGRMQVITDQRRYVDYKQANRLRAEAKTQNVLPTAAPVPLLFTHEQSRITFRLAGQNANGLIIKELLLEINANIEDGEGVKGAGFWAYCGDGTEDPEEEGNGVLNARMIMPAGTVFGPGINDGGLMRVGLVTVGRENDDSDDYRGLIYIPNSTNITLDENTDYLVTLTPEGYDLYASISITGFNQSEGHVAIPFQLPVINGEGVYEISTVAQLVTVSWLLSGDLNGEKQADWLRRTFDIVNSIEVSSKIQAEEDRYLKASVLQSNADKFSNTENATFADGTPVFGE